MDHEVKIDVGANALRDHEEGPHAFTLTTDDCRKIARIVLDAVLAAERATCTHQRKQGTGSAGSDGSSSFSGFCLDCGKDLSYKISGALADPMLQLQPRN